jgi:predicted metal-dependent TIM-barrel fold hydrolase
VVNGINQTINKGLTVFRFPTAMTYSEAVDIVRERIKLLGYSILLAPDIMVGNGDWVIDFNRPSDIWDEYDHY